MYYLLVSSLPSGKFSGRTKLLKMWTQTSAFIDLSPPTEKIGQETKSLTTSLITFYRIKTYSAVSSGLLCLFMKT